MIIQGFAFWDEFLPYSSLCSLALSTVALPTNGYWTEQDVNFLLEKPRRSPTIFPRNFTRKRRQNDTGHFLYSSETGPADFCPLLQGVARAGQGSSRPTWPQDEPKRVPFQRQGAGHVCSLYAQVYYLPQWKTAGFSATTRVCWLRGSFCFFLRPQDRFDATSRHRGQFHNNGQYRWDALKNTGSRTDRSTFKFWLDHQSALYPGANCLMFQSPSFCIWKVKTRSPTSQTCWEKNTNGAIYRSTCNTQDTPSNTSCRFHSALDLENCDLLHAI